MANVFEQEGSPTQDSSFREHLDRNWEAGNKKFAELESKVKNTEKNVRISLVIKIAMMLIKRKKKSELKL